MKILRPLWNIIILILLSSCGSVEYTDIPESSSLVLDGLLPGDVYLSVRDERVVRTEFYYEEKISIEFDDIEGFNREDGKAYAGVSVAITQGLDTVHFKRDVFPQLDSGTTLVDLDLETYFRAIFNFRNREPFHLNLKMWDKRGNGTASFNMPFTIIENPNFDITNNGLEHKTIFFYDEIAEEALTNNEFVQGQPMVLYFEGIEGLTEVNGKVFPAFSISIVDSLGHVMIDNSNIFDDIPDEGVAIEDFEQVFPLVFGIDQGLTAPTANLKARLYDLKSNKSIELKTKFKLVKPKEGLGGEENSLQHAV